VSEKIKVVVLQILDWMHYVMARLAPNEPEIHDEIDKLIKEGKWLEADRKLERNIFWVWDNESESVNDRIVLDLRKLLE